MVSRVIIVLALLLFCPIQVYAVRDASFIWLSNPPEDMVTGYKFYYKCGGGGPPYDGTHLVEGHSPIIIPSPDTLALTIHGLSDYCEGHFALTAYREPYTYTDAEGTVITLPYAESTYTQELVIEATAIIPVPENFRILSVEETQN